MTERKRPKGSSRSLRGTSSKGGSASRPPAAFRGPATEARAADRTRRAGPKGRAGTRSRPAPAPKPAPPAKPSGAPAVVQPPVVVSFARGLVAAGSSPALSATAFLAILVLWASFTAVSQGLVASASGLVQFLSLPPGHNFVDYGLLRGSRLSPAITLTYGVVVLCFRALLDGFLIAGADIAIRSRVSASAMARAAGRRALETFWVLLAIEAGYLVATIFVEALPLVLGAQAEVLIYSIWLIGGVYLLVYIEIVAVVERASLRDAVILGIRAARLPGREHVLLVFGYALASLLFPTFAARIAGVEATPSIAAWVYALVVGFLNVSVIAMFTWRWNLIREAVKAGPVIRPRRPRRW